MEQFNKFMKKIALIASFAFLSLGISAQSEDNKPSKDSVVPVLKDSTTGTPPEDLTVGDVKGTVQNKVIYLAKPAFPPAAGEAGAEGAVRVQITIGKEGTVTSAQMISGHPLLKETAEDAARRSKFRIMRDPSGEAIETQGALTYNFVIRKISWSRIGYGLSVLDRAPAASFPITAARKTFAPEWTAELQMLEKLAEIRRTEPAMPPRPTFVAASPTNVKERNNVKSVSIAQVYLRSAPSAEQIALSQNLISALTARLGSDEIASWQFNLGLDLRRAIAMQRHPDANTEGSLIIRRSIERAPAKASAEVIQALENLATIFARPKASLESPNEITKALNVIFSDKP